MDAPANTPAVILKPQELILTLVGEYVQPGGKVWSGGLVQVLQTLDFTTAGARVALKRVMTRGLFEIVKEGRRVFYTAQPRLTELLAEGHRQTFWFRYPSARWDGDWTLVWYAIPEDLQLARRRLSRRLSFLGFGALQDGTWLAPRDRTAELSRTVDELGLGGHVAAFVGVAPGWVPRQTLLSQAWDLTEAASRYTDIIERFHRYRSPRARANLRPVEAFVTRTFLIEAVRQVSVFDPKLSDSDLGLQWDRAEALELFEEVDAALRPAAKTYFDKIVETAS